MSEKLERIADELGQLTRTEAAELGRMLEEKWGVRASSAFTQLLGQLPASPAEDETEEPTEFDIVLKEAGVKKIEVIKVIRQLTDLGLGEAKALAEAANARVLAGVGKDAALDAKRRLEEAGAQVVFQTSGLAGEGTTDGPPPKR